MDSIEYSARSRKWRVVSASLLVAMMDYGFLFALGSIFIPMIETFGVNRSRAATVQSIYNGVTFASSAASGLFVSKFGPSIGILVSSVLIPLGFFLSFFAKYVEHLYVSLGVIAGVGNSFVIVSTINSVGRLLPRRERSVALSIQMTLIGFAGVIYPYVLDWLLYMYGLNGTFLLLSGFYLHTFIAAIVYRYDISDRTMTAKIKPRKFMNIISETYDSANFVTSDPKEYRSDKTDLQEKELTLSQFPEVKEPICSATFGFFAIATSLLIASLTCFIIMAQEICTEKELSNSQTLACFLVFNTCNALSRLAPIVASKMSMDIFSISLTASIFGFSGQMLLFYFESYALVMLGVGLSGAAVGAAVSAFIVATFDLLFPERQSVGYGIIDTLGGISVSALGPFLGAIRDAFGDYKYVLVITSSLNGLSIVLTICVILIYNIRKRGLKSKSCDQRSARKVVKDVKGVKGENTSL